MHLGHLSQDRPGRPVTGCGAGEGEPAVPGTDRTSRHGRAGTYPRSHGQPERDPRLPDLTAGQDHPGAGGPARLFLDPSAPQFYLDWERQAQDTVAILRSEAGRNPHDRALSGLIGELSTRSEIFRTWWAAHNVRFHRTGVKRFHHPVVGDLTLAYEALDLAADEGLRVSAYTAETGSASEDALNLLASWAATLDQAGSAAGQPGQAR
ncbi:MAG: hypothetical protein ACLP8X_23195 [Streptosporangiaceae bacterium]